MDFTFQLRALLRQVLQQQMPQAQGFQPLLQEPVGKASR
jgi:uncharacterized lipoprotein YajG